MGFSEAIKQYLFSTPPETEEERKKRLERQAMLQNIAGNPYQARVNKLNQILEDAQK